MPRNKTSQPQKTSAKKVPLNIQRITEQRLIDGKLLQSAQTQNRGIPHLVAWSAFLGFVVGGIILIYFFKDQNRAEQNYTPQIIVPKAAVTEQRETAPPAPAAPTSTSAEVAVQKVEILDTPTGFLNVRSGPGTNFSKIGQVAPGEIFDLVSSDAAKGWYEIRLTATSTGWVTKQYSRVIDNQ